MGSAAAAAAVVFSYTGGPQSFVVTTSGLYDIVAVGASGGNGAVFDLAGVGAVIGGDFRLVSGQVLTIDAGGAGVSLGNAIEGGDLPGGGGGGSFVVLQGDSVTALVIAGGGGGGGILNQPNLAPGTAANGQLGTSGGYTYGGVGGSGGAGGGVAPFTAGGGGGGFISAGQSATATGGGSGGQSYPSLAGGSGSVSTYLATSFGFGGGDGGFGGGGSGGAYSGGGGGGYSGGGGGGDGFAGGGGGSFNSSALFNADDIATVSASFGNGLVTLTLLSPTVISTPEPASFGLLGVGLVEWLGLRGLLRRQRGWPGQARP